MNRKVLYLVATMFFVTCNKEEPIDNTPFVVEVAISYAGSVKAMIGTYQKLSNGEYGLQQYEFTSITEENSGFKLNLPATLPHELILFNRFIGEGFTVSDIQARTSTLSISTVDSYDGRPVGVFSLSSDGYEWSAEYVYADRDFTEKGTNVYGLQMDCSYKKGWNIVYQHDKKITTQKPFNEIFRWIFHART